MTALREEEPDRQTNCTMPRVYPEDDLVTFITDCLDYAVERGSADAIRAYLGDERWSSDVEEELAIEVSPLRARIMRAKEALERMEAFEAIHGDGSALIVDHPFNIKLAMHGLLDLSMAGYHRGWDPAEN